MGSGFPRDAWDRSVYRLGNLTWLEQPLNRQLGNADFATKREACRGSGCALTRDIPGSVGQEWTPSRLDRRQDHMARRALHLWRAGFA